MTDPALDPYLESIEADLRQAALPSDSPAPAAMAEMIAYHLGWAGESTGRGKRIRPLITLLACQACGGDWPRALPAASAVELIHNFSLVHDDIEDRSETRRGRPTLWSRWGLSQALNTGDALFALAHLSLHRLGALGVSPQVLNAVQHDLTRACLDLTCGQHLDMAFETQPTVTTDSYAQMVAGKTAALLAAAASMGARVAGAPASRIQVLAEFGRQLGLAFQMEDDILGIWGDPALTGKPAGDDLLCRKKSLPTLLGLERSPTFRQLWSSDPIQPSALDGMRHALQECGAQAATLEAARSATRQALEALELSRPQDPAAGLLRDLSHQLIGRQH